jgi:hypothetical protein
VTTLAELTRLLPGDPGDGLRMDHGDVKTLALIDLDGDGNHDPILIRKLDSNNLHGVELAVWSSTQRTLTAPVTLPQVFSVDVPPGQTSLPLVLRLHTFHEYLPTTYRCVEADETLDRCPALVALTMGPQELLPNAASTGDTRDRSTLRAK